MASKKRFDVVTPRPKYGGGTWWHRVGNAHQNEEGRITIYLDSVPVPDPEKDNKIVMMLFEPREDDADSGKKGKGSGAGAGKGKRGQQQASLSEELDDEIPF